MGLAERRAAKEFETNRFPTLKKEIVDAACFDLPIEVKWETMSADGYAHMYDEAWTKVYFKPLVQAFKAICIDAMGKDALKAGVKKVVIQNTAGVYYGDRCCSLNDGVLTLDHEPVTNVDDVDARAKGIQTTLEKAL